ncbi:MAG: hypothetical protein SVK08_01600 [Halobacteriota archaeon]|nr:hypothetical protein [Halobacteriota archaeon]
MKDINITFRGSDGVATFGFQKKSTAIEGVEKLLQVFVKNLLTRMGSDFFSPENGGNIPRYLEYNVNDQQEIRSNLMIDIDRLVSRMRATQAKQELPDTERIKSATLTDIDIRSGGEIYISIMLAALSGDYQIATLPIRRKG